MTIPWKSHARELDAHERPIEAAEAYENAIAQGEADLDLYLTLAGLYLVCQDFGYLSAKKLPNEFIAKAWTRFKQLLEEAENRYGASDRIDFWRSYGRWRVLGEQSEEPRLRELYLKGNVPESAVDSFELENIDELRKRLLLLRELVSGKNTIIARDLLAIADSGLIQLKDQARREKSESE